MMFEKPWHSVKQYQHHELLFIPAVGDGYRFAVRWNSAVPMCIYHWRRLLLSVSRIREETQWPPSLEEQFNSCRSFLHFPSASGLRCYYKTSRQLIKQYEANIAGHYLSVMIWWGALPPASRTLGGQITGQHWHAVNSVVGTVEMERYCRPRCMSLFHSNIEIIVFSHAIINHVGCIINRLMYLLFTAEVGSISLWNRPTGARGKIEGRS